MRNRLSHSHDRPQEAPPIFRTYFSDSLVNDPEFWPRSVLQAVFLPLRDPVRESGYAAVSGRLLRAPILRAFADARAPQQVKDWISSVGTMGKFDRIVTAHFASPIMATPEDFAAAFDYLKGPTSEPPIACQDWSLLDGLNYAIETNKLGAKVVFDYKQGCT